MSLKDDLKKNLAEGEKKPKYVNAPGTPSFNKEVQKSFDTAKKAIAAATKKGDRKAVIVVEWQSTPADVKQLATEVCALLIAEGLQAELGQFWESKWTYHQKVVVSF